MSQPRRTYPDSLRYTVYVLFMHGYSYGQIAKNLNKSMVEPLTGKNIGAILRRSDYYARKDMTIELRQKHLDILKRFEESSGNYIIEDWAFTAQPLDDKRQK